MRKTGKVKAKEKQRNEEQEEEEETEKRRQVSFARVERGVLGKGIYKQQQKSAKLHQFSLWQS